MSIVDSVTDLVGETPLVRLDSVPGTVVGKLESANPTHSVKDRIAVAMLEAAEERGRLDDGTTIIEPTSGNTGVGLAAAAAAKGYDLVLTMPESMSEERRRLLAAFGADLVLTPSADGMDGAVERAHDLAADTEGAFVPEQFENRANPRVHRETTGREIWEATDGDVDVVVAGVGTGGTITGVAEHLVEERGADVTVVGVEPAGSPVLSGGDPGSHGIQGIGAGFVPDVLRTDLLDDVVTVEGAAAEERTRQLATEEGILAGVSSGAALDAAARVAARPEHEDDRVVVVLPDTGERYLSTDLFAHE
ncbi:cysteine synthase [Halarchaeum grantii]|uniref:cysteine synthase n=1 Tax=Halarchaeum grantii TaxID=1193105 RepID=A0A830FD02_9EURY|nr:cysteine synthase A [Halarchaeum grantii]GGL42483.1 cysteine synthase [Halarchaeum grantii]